MSGSSRAARVSLGILVRLVSGSWTYLVAVALKLGVDNESAMLNAAGWALGLGALAVGSAGLYAGYRLVRGPRRRTRPK